MTGYKAPRCECGHTAGEHRTVANGLRIQAGVCLIRACACRVFTETKAAA